MENEYSKSRETYRIDMLYKFERRNAVLNQLAVLALCSFIACMIIWLPISGTDCIIGCSVGIAIGCIMLLILNTKFNLLDRS